MTSGGRTAVTGYAESKAAVLRLDDALRQYLAERGPKAVPLAALSLLTSGVTRLRLSADAIASLDDGASGPGRTLRARRRRRWWPRTAAIWPRGTGASRPHCAMAGPRPRVSGRRARPRITSWARCAHEVASGAELRADPSVSVLLSSSGYLDELEDLRLQLLAPAAQLRARRAEPRRRPGEPSTP